MKEKTYIICLETQKKSIFHLPNTSLSCPLRSGVTADYKLTKKKGWKWKKKKRTVPNKDHRNINVKIKYDDEEQSGVLSILHKLIHLKVPI